MIRASGVFFPENLAKSGWRLHRAITSPSRYPDANAWGLATEGKEGQGRVGGRGNYRATERKSGALLGWGPSGTGSHLLEVAHRLGYPHVIAQPTT